MNTQDFLQLVSEMTKLLSPVLIILLGIAAGSLIIRFITESLRTAFVSTQKEHDERKEHDHDYPEYSTEDLGLDWADEPDGELILLDQYEEYQQHG